MNKEQTEALTVLEILLREASCQNLIICVSITAKMSLSKMAAGSFTNYS